MQQPKPRQKKLLQEEIDRSSSAPPTALTDDTDQQYAAFFYTNSRLDPRLPPPKYEPGQSWQLWSKPSAVAHPLGQQPSSANGGQAGVIGGRSAIVTAPESAPAGARTSHRHLMDMIQQDFPRTPSPVFNDSNHKGDDMQRLRLSSKTPPPPGLFNHLVAPPRSSSTPPTRQHGKTVGLNSSPLVSQETMTEDDMDEQIVSSMRNAGLMDDEDDAAFGFRQPSFAPAPKEQQQYAAFKPSYTVQSAPYQPASYYPQQSAQLQHQQQGQAPRSAPFKQPQKPYAPSPQRKQAPAQSRNGKMDAFLEEFLITQKQKRYELKDIKGHVVQFCSDQHGSRFIQQKLEYASAEDRNDAFKEIVDNDGCLLLMSDVFGNYCIQKFFEYGTSAQRTQLVLALKGHVFPLSQQMYGCRVVQKALEFSSAKEQSAIVAELKGHIATLVKDQNGNHVVQKAIEIANPTDVRMIIESFYGQVFPLATHAYGCRVMQRIFEHCGEDLTRPLISELGSFTQTLVQDQYGNYVIQHILERGNKADRQNILNQVKGQILHLSRHKFASNVIEKCVIYSSEQGRQEILDELLAVPSKNAADSMIPLMQMMRDQFANYVVQKLLEVVTRAQMEQIVAKVRPQVVNIRKLTYGKHILTKLEKIIGHQTWMEE